MLLQVLLALADGATPGSFGPSVSGVAVVSISPGSCGSVNSAMIRASWTVGNRDDALYVAKVYENGVLVYSGTAASYDKTFLSYVENGPESVFISDIVYRVDLVRIADSHVMSTASSIAWVQAYGTCGSAIIP